MIHQSHFNTMKKQRRGLNRYNVLTDGDPWSAKQHHWKSEAKKDHQLSPGTDRSDGSLCLTVWVSVSVPFSQSMCLDDI